MLPAVKILKTNNWLQRLVKTVWFWLPRLKSWDIVYTVHGIFLNCLAFLAPDKSFVCGSVLYINNKSFISSTCIPWRRSSSHRLLSEFWNKLWTFLRKRVVFSRNNSFKCRVMSAALWGSFVLSPRTSAYAKGKKRLDKSLLQAFTAITVTSFCPGAGPQGKSSE